MRTFRWTERKLYSDDYEPQEIKAASVKFEPGFVVFYDARAHMIHSVNAQLVTHLYEDLPE